jgi:hypothetical protein
MKKKNLLKFGEHFIMSQSDLDPTEAFNLRERISMIYAAKNKNIKFQTNDDFELSVLEFFSCLGDAKMSEAIIITN